MVLLDGLQLNRLGRHDVQEAIDAFSVRRAVRVSALRVGFSARVAGELVLVASELTTNILKYGRHGWINVDSVEVPDRGLAFQIEARDFGLPFHDFELALLDRHDDRGPILPDARRISQGLGVGLGTVARFSDHVEHARLDDGKVVRALRFLVSKRR